MNVLFIPTYTRAHALTHTQIRTHERTHARAHTHTYSESHTHTHTHTHTNTHFLSRNKQPRNIYATRKPLSSKNKTYICTPSQFLPHRHARRQNTSCCPEINCVICIADFTQILTHIFRKAEIPPRRVPLLESGQSGRLSGIGIQMPLPSEATLSSSSAHVMSSFPHASRFLIPEAVPSRLRWRLMPR